MIYVKEVIIVEGRYDKNTVAQVVNGTIIETSGFGILKNKDKIALLRRLAAQRGLIIFTDSDKAGFFIRGRLHGMLGDINIKHAFTPDIKGCERRKHSSSKEGKLGVEGMTREVILKALEAAGASFSEDEVESGSVCKITKADLYELGLSGGIGSAIKRRELLIKLDLPEHLSANGLLNVLNVLFTRDEFIRLKINNKK